MRSLLSSIRHFYPLLFLITVLGIAPSPPNQQIYQPNNSSDFSLPPISDLPSANQSQSEPNNQTLNGTNVKCLRASYGTIENPESCRRAFLSIPGGSTERYTFGARNLGFFEVQLPHRFLSPDGLCAIDIAVVPRGAQFDWATYEEVAEKAAAILSACVLDRRRGSPAGGILGGLGQNGDLNVIIRSYVPEVECDPTTPFAEGGTCAKAVDTIPTTGQATTFTRQKSPSSRFTRQVEVPVGGKVFSEHSGRCNATVNLSRDEPETSTWFDVWQAAVAVDTICVRKGYKGFSYLHGGEDNLIVSLGP